MEATATLKYLKASPQKVRLVADLVRGKKVEEALAILRFTRKSCAKDLEKLLRSAVANAENKEAGADVDELVVSKIYVNEGPREKRIMPAPMGLKGLPSPDCPAGGPPGEGYRATRY